MTTEDLFTAAEKKADKPPENSPAQSNVPEFSVGELAQSLKRTLEDTYGRVRVRGELSGTKVAASGHLYGDIKDENAVVNIVCWRGNLSRLSIRPEDGLEVVVTGRVSSYPKSSRYQIIIESMELAGEGALLKMLEDRRKKLAAEGLFAPERKKPLPFLPKIIGVITSPTGAVIRDIMHRLEDRFPRHVLLWPVPVQGEGAADKIAAGIRGFNRLDGTKIPKPDLLIVARGGGSLEDLMAFNEETVIRAVADSDIPVISAVGHETDVTLIDYAADERAPTPTGAAEIAVPVRLNLLAGVMEYEERIITAAGRMISDLRNVVAATAAKLGDPKHLLDVKIQSLDFLSGNLQRGFEKGVQAKQSRLSELGALLRHPRSRLDEAGKLLDLHSQSLLRAGQNILKEPENKISHLGRLLDSFSFKEVLKRGFTVLRDEHGTVITCAEQTQDGTKAELEFADGTVKTVLGKRV